MFDTVSTSPHKYSHCQASEQFAEPEVRILSDAPGSRLSLRCNIVWTLVGNLIYAGCQWGMLVVLAKSGSPELVGIFGLALAVTNPIIMLTNLQLGVLQATDATGQYRFCDYIAVRLLMNILALAMVMAVVLVQGYARDVGSVILIMGVAKVIEAISDIIYGALQQHERVDQIAWLQIIKGILSLALMTVVVYAGGSVTMAVLAMAGVWLVCLVVCDLPALACLLRAHGTESLSPSWDRETIGRIVRYALPLGLAMMLGSLTLNMPQYFIEHYLGLHELGIFVALASLMVLGRKFFNPIVHTASARLSHLYAQGDAEGFRALVTKLLILATAIGLVAVVVSMSVGRVAIRLIYAAEYADHHELLVWLMIALTLSCQSAVDPAFTALRCMREPVILWGATLLLLTACLMYLVPQHGLIGVGMAIAFSNAGRLVLTLIALRMSIRRRFAALLSSQFARSLDNNSVMK